MDPRIGIVAAQKRAVVALPDGRTGRLVCAPARNSGHHSRGGKARVQLPSGRYLSVALDQLTIVGDQAPT